MKNSILLLSLILSLLFANNCFAQVEDPLNQNSLKVQENWSTQDEKPIVKKKKNNQNQTTTPQVQKPTVEKPTAQKPKITNTCPDILTVEFVSLTGNTASQEVTMVIKFVNHDINRDMSLNHFLAYNEEGNSFDKYHISSYNALTDVPVRAEWYVGQMLPSKNSKLPAISFILGGCTIEMRDVTIDWK